MKKYLFTLVFSLLLLLPKITVLAADNGSTPCNGCQLNNPISATTVEALVGKLINTAMGVVGSLALLMFIYGGFTWMLSAGSSEKIKKGKDIVIWSALGMVLIFMSYALVRFVLETIQQPV